MSAVFPIALREFQRAWRGGGLWTPVTFFLMVAILFPFAIGPDTALLQRAGGGVAWVAALLAALLPVERLVEPDRIDGVLDQFAVRGIADESVAAGKILGHWLGFAPALLIAALPAGALFQFDAATMVRLLSTLAVGTPALAALAVAAAALTAGLRGASAVAGMLVLPLAIPVLIFGAAAAGDGGAGAFKLLAASSLLLTALAPFATGFALRAIRT
jgi:heme exporter protein B